MDPDDQRAEFASFRLSAIAAIDGEARGIDRHLAVRVRAKTSSLGSWDRLSNPVRFPPGLRFARRGTGVPARVDEHVLVGQNRAAASASLRRSASS